MPYDDTVDPSHWSLDKRFNIGHFLTTVVIAGMLFAWASNVSERVSVLEANDIYFENRLDRDAIRAREDFARLERGLSTLKEYLVRIEDKLNDKADKD